MKIKKAHSQAIFKVILELENIFDTDKEYYLEHENVNFKVRPGYGYDKFYLDWVDGSYDMSLQSLVNFILYEEKLYKKFLSKEAYKEVAMVVKNYPETIPDISDKHEIEQRMIDDITWKACVFMGCKFKKANLDYSSFKSAGYMDEEDLKLFDSCYICCDEIISDAFLYSLNDYLRENILTQNEMDRIVILSKSLYEIKDFIYLATIIYPFDNTSAKNIIKLAIEEATKKSEYSQLAFFVKNTEYLHDIKWGEDILALKEKL